MFNGQVGDGPAAPGPAICANVPTDTLVEPSSLMAATNTSLLGRPSGPSAERCGLVDRSASNCRVQDRQSTELIVRRPTVLQRVHTEAEWDDIRPIITELYLTERKPLKEVMRILQEDHEFRATYFIAVALLEQELTIKQDTNVQKAHHEVGSLQETPTA